MHYDRGLAAEIRTAANQFPAIVLTGARQVGKTTLLRQLFPTLGYVSLDLPSAAELAEQSPGQFLELHSPPLLIDEVQYAPKLFRHLKVAIDERRHDMGRFILTGSKKFTLMKGVADSTLELLEAKWSENPDARDSSLLKTVASLLREKSSRSAVSTTIVCRTPHRSMLDGQTKVTSPIDLLVD